MRSLQSAPGLNVPKSGMDHSTRGRIQESLRTGMEKVYAHNRFLAVLLVPVILPDPQI